jgi:cytochrome c-type biogenesis protein CcmE
MTERQRKTALYLGGAVLLAGFVTLGFTSFTSNMTTYVSFEQAQQAERRVQVAGSLVAGSVREDRDADGVLAFTIEDDAGARLPVRYRGVRPANFDEASKVVVIGQWAGDTFRSEQMLIKCPSKYEGEPVAGGHPDDIPQS